MSAAFVAYCLQRYPALRTTFVRREIEALRKMGLEIRAVSMRPADRDSLAGDADALSHIESTTYLPDNPMAVRFCWANVVWALRSPWATLRNLGLLLADPGRYGRWRRVRLALQVWRAAPVASALRRAGRCTHIHAHFADGAATTALAASRLLSVPFSFTSHTSHDSPALREKFAEAAFIASISDYDRERLVARGAPTERVHVVRCGLPLDEWRYRPRESLHEPLRLLSIGALIETKGHDVLIRTCRRLIAEGISLECRIVGDGPLRGELMSLITKLELEDSVRLLGPMPQAQVRRELNWADMFVLACKATPSGDTDGIPVALMEAMADGCPVVSTRISGVPELISHEVSGLLAEPGSVESLCSMIRRLATAQIEPAALARAARTKIETEFSALSQARLLAQLLSAVIRESAAVGAGTALA